MNCRGWNPQIALYVEGDLERELSRQLEGHMEGCEECRSFADALRDSQAEIRQLRNEVIEPAALNRVRAKVLQQVRAMDERRTWLDRAGMWLFGGFRWRHAVLGSAALILAVSFIWRVSSNTVLPEVQLEAPPRLVATMSPVASAPVVGSPKRHVASSKRLKSSEPVSSPATEEPSPVDTETPAASRDTLVQIITDDPNVVIFWLLDQTGGL